MVYQIFSRTIPTKTLVNEVIFLYPFTTFVFSVLKPQQSAFESEVRQRNGLLYFEGKIFAGLVMIISLINAVFTGWDSKIFKILGLTNVK